MHQLSLASASRSHAPELVVKAIVTRPLKAAGPCPQPLLLGLQELLPFILELPDPLARDLELVPELGERGWVAVVEAVAPDQDVPRPLRQTLDRLFEVNFVHLAYHFVRRVRRPFVLDEFPDLGGGLLGGHRPIEARGIWHLLHHEPDLLGWPSEAFGD